MRQKILCIWSPPCHSFFLFFFFLESINKIFSLIWNLKTQWIFVFGIICYYFLSQHNSRKMRLNLHTGKVYVWILFITALVSKYLLSHHYLSSHTKTDCLLCQDSVCHARKYSIAVQLVQLTSHFSQENPQLDHTATLMLGVRQPKFGASLCFLGSVPTLGHPFTTAEWLHGPAATQNVVRLVHLR